MTGIRWLSEAINTDDIRNGAMNLIVAPTGSGKSIFALETLPKLASNKNMMLYLIDTINGRDQLLKHENTKPCDDNWIHSICRQIIDFKRDEIFEEDKIVIMTYAKFGVLANAFPGFGEHFEVIVCDEIHSGIEMTNYDRSQKENYPRIAIERIKQIIRFSKVKVIGLTATPSKVEEEFYGLIGYIPVDKDIRQYETFKEIPYTNLDAVISRIDKDSKGIIYAGHITQMKGIIGQAQKVGIKAIGVWSINNPDHEMTQEQRRVRDYILDTARMPSEYNLLVINKSCETSITIDGDIDYMIIHSRVPERRIQVRGRLRRDLETMYVLDYNAEIEVPFEFMGRKLFQQDKEALCSSLKLRNQQGNLVKWTTVKDELIKAGYTVTEGRLQNRRYVIITL
jgi:superfamily II DNA or RNA helicase